MWAIISLLPTVNSSKYQVLRVVKLLRVSHCSYLITKSEPLCRHERVFGKTQFKIFYIEQWDAEILYVPQRTGFSLNEPHSVGKARHNLRSSLVTDCANSIKFPTISCLPES
jgi:hypothetical protein